MSVDLTPYPAMKDSGVPWLGEVPQHWEVRKLRRTLRAVAARNRSDLPLLSVVREKGVVLRDVSNKDENHNFIPDDLTHYKVVQHGQFAMNKMKAWQGSYGVSKFKGLVSPAYFVFDLDGVDGDYFHAALRSKAYVPYFTQASDGVRIGQWDLSLARMREISFLVPPLPEQASIVRFLDYADRRIRRYIRAKQQLITLLEEQKQALIHQAVTGQIDVRTGQPYGAYKPAGVLGLPEVPKEWELCRLRNVVSVVTTGSRGWSPYASDTGPLFVRVANLSRGSLKLRFDDEMRLDLPITSEAGRTRIEPGDLLVSVTAYIGSVGVAPEEFEEAYVSQHVARCQPLPEVCSRWLGYVLLSSVGQTHGQVSLYGGTKDGLSLDDVKNYPILLPPRNEQEAAVQWIDGELSALVKIGDSTKRELEMVREYRTRLIADIVTGKLDVREAAARLPDEVGEPEPLDETDALTDIEDEPADNLDAVPEEAEV